MKLFKTRNVIEMLTRPATEEERRGERNSAILGWLMVLAVVGIFLYGCYAILEKAVA